MDDNGVTMLNRVTMVVSRDLMISRFVTINGERKAQGESQEMRSAELLTVNIMVLSAILTIGSNAVAQVNPKMEARLSCDQSECMFRGSFQTPDNIGGPNKDSMPHLINDFASNPPLPVDLAQIPQFALVGELQRDEKLPNGNIAQHLGSSVIVSPCYILTNFHVAFGADKTPVAGKDYTAVFRAGQGQEPGTFAGHTFAKPVVWGDARQDDWAIMRLKNCVGTMKAFGWVEASSKTQRELIAAQTPVVAVGYSYRTQIAALQTFSWGIIKAKDPVSGMMKFSASMAAKQSGGALFTVEDGVMVLAGLTTGEMFRSSDVGADGVAADEFKRWDETRSNLAQSTFEILNRSDIKELLDSDKSNWTAGNPATERLIRPLPSARTQMTKI